MKIYRDYPITDENTAVQYYNNGTCVYVYHDYYDDNLELMD